MQGRFVVFEGGDGVGKSTQARLLAQALVERGREVVLTREPGEGPVGAKIRAILLDPETGDLSPRAEALLYSADRAHHVDAMILPAIERGGVVVCDRFIDSTLAYQGAGRVLDMAELEPIARWAAGDLVPDLTILLDLHHSVGLATIDEPDRLESAGDDFHARTREQFLALAARAPERYLVLPARDSIASLAERILARVIPLLDEPLPDAEGTVPVGVGPDADGSAQQPVASDGEGSAHTLVASDAEGAAPDGPVVGRGKGAVSRVAVELSDADGRLGS